ncbi:MAG: sugar phosphate isomerase/epimerase family protein, partial [Candidatus Brocadiia bacterium]|nr:sugar phosphate isomerase/epimerase family protein [Candidatus Brocadiia bacterium]
MPVRFAMCNEFCEGWDFERACRLAAETGYSGIELAPFTLSERVEDLGPEERDALRDTAARNGIEIVGLHWLLVTPGGLYINHTDEAIRRRTTRYLRAEIDFCADLGGRVVIVGSPKQRNVLPQDTYAAAWDRTVEVFRELGPHATERGVCLCLEPLGTTETNFLAASGEVLRMVEAVGQPAVRMMLDVKAMCAERE